MRDFLLRRAAHFVSAPAVVLALVLGGSASAWAQTPAPAPAVVPQPQPATQPPAAPLAAPPPAPPGAYPAAPGGYAPAPNYPPPPGYGYPPYGTDYSRMRLPPSTVPYEGGPVPQGWHVEERPRRGLVIAGSIVLGVPYAIGLAGAGGSNFPNSSGWLILPGLGPWLTLAARHSSSPNCFDCGSSDDDVTRTFLILDGLMQAGGAVMLIGGIVSPTKVLARDFVGSLHFAPSTIGRNGYGGFVMGQF